MKIIFINGDLSKRKTYRFVIDEWNRIMLGCYYSYSRQYAYFYKHGWNREKLDNIKKSTIIVIKQPTFSKTLRVLFHEFVHYLIDKFLKDDKKYHNKLDKIKD